MRCLTLWFLSFLRLHLSCLWLSSLSCSSSSLLLELKLLFICKLLGSFSLSLHLLLTLLCKTLMELLSSLVILLKNLHIDVSSLGFLVFLMKDDSVIWLLAIPCLVIWKIGCIRWIEDLPIVSVSVLKNSISLLLLRCDIIGNTSILVVCGLVLVASTVVPTKVGSIRTLRSRSKAWWVSSLRVLLIRFLGWDNTPSVSTLLRIRGIIILWRLISRPVYSITHWLCWVRENREHPPPFVSAKDLIPIVSRTNIIDTSESLALFIKVFNCSLVVLHKVYMELQEESHQHSNHTVQDITQLDDEIVEKFFLIFGGIRPVVSVYLPLDAH